MTIKLIVGLSNYGNQYTFTRHNAGAWYLKKLVELNGSIKKRIFEEKKHLLACINHMILYDKIIYLLLPMTSMNISGQSVLAVKNFYRILSQEILIVHDDLDLLPGIVKLQLGGSHGGHNGLKSIIQYLGYEMNFYRLRIGIGRPDKKNKKNIASFVLGTPLLSEKILIEEAIHRAINCTYILVKDGIEKAMQRLNKKNNYSL
ncbi:aminoacyl-tRNA hydrolase [Candidatus Schneideria nysicola]|uniref:aminoacyl-tRNA hydrolase n=1 Tax=Candidatus Schneideria nysicola TaxID=1081631 RepID=UPI001CAA5D3D|nr:aminoacyl-tRNA hydrolase [Candidatus Schneideria nysicola]UAJ65692.1 aminoacyl-tRNA hydrolase [Candidatus Schneideria nysicola]UAJ66219.1 aminoacyl-tRNA hydrolase [Candidatus Schneideria nysicola]